MRAIDFHTHAFPDSLAEKAIPLLESEAEDARAVLDGKIGALLKSMDKAGIEISVVASIATKPKQWASILTWSQSIASSRIIPFASVHPDDPQCLEQISRIQEAGLKGIKLHPYYQDFNVDEKRLYPLYESVQGAGLILLFHAGFDVAFERIRKADPERILTVFRNFPGLKFVASHFGAWEDWDNVERFLLGKPIYMDISYSFQYMSREQARRILLNHPKEYLLFGSDSPWADQKITIESLLEMDIGEERNRAILFDNAARLLGIKNLSLKTCA
jgi:predicted TIM-barrel fold metal-dependent hydrolase